jgi:MFS family permease
LHSFLNGFALVLFEATASTLFLTKYETAQIPYVYIASAFLSVIIGFIYTKIEERLSIYGILKAIFIFIFVSILLQFFLISSTDFKPAYFGMMVLKDVLWMLVGIEFGMLTSVIFDIRQGKRLFGLLASGEILAGIIAGLSIGTILQYMDTSYLLLISSTIMVLSFFVLVNILKKFSHKFDKVDVDEEHSHSHITYTSIFKNSYYVNFFIISMLAFLVFYFIDFMFYYNVEQQYPSEKELAKFFGIFYAVLNIVNLFSSFVISGKAISRYGIAFGLMIIPVMATVGTLSLITAISLSLSIAFLLMVIMKLLNEVFDISLLSPSFKIVYQSIPAAQRNKIIALRETTIEPVAMGLAGVLLIFLNSLENKDIIYYSIIVLSIIWIVLSVALKKGYVTSLKKITNYRHVFSKDMDLKDIGEDFFLQRLESKNYIEVIHALESLQRLEHKDLLDIIATYVKHPNKDVRLKCLEIISGMESMEFFRHIKKLIRNEENEEVKSKAILVYCKLGEIEAIKYIETFLENPQFDKVKTSAISGLIKYCGIDGILLAGPYITKLFESKDEKNILIALNILNDIGVQGYLNYLRKTINSKNRNVKIATIKTIGNLNIKKFISTLIVSINEPTLKKESVNSLKKFGIFLADKLKTEFEHSTDTSFKESIIAILAAMRDEKINNYLLECIERQPIFLEKTVHELAQNSYRSKSIETIEKLININTVSMLELSANYTLLDKENHQNSIVIIQEQLEMKKEINFVILSFFYNKDTMNKAMITFKSTVDEKRPYAIELLDNTLNSNLKKQVIPLLETTSVSQIVSKYQNIVYEKFSDSLNFIQHLLMSQDIDDILKVSLIYEIGKNQDNRFQKELDLYMELNKPFFNDTVIWAKKQIG